MEYKNNIHQVLPMDYIPVESIMICSNMLSKFKYIINDNGFFPILIGLGEIPRIWIYAKSGTKSISVVRDNVSTISQVKVNIHSKEKRINVELITNSRQDKILCIDYMNSVPTIKSMNLTSIGYNIIGDENELLVGQAKMVGNKFEGVESFIMINNNN